MKEPEKIEEFAENLKSYLNVCLELNKLEAIERTSVIGPSLITGILMGIIGILFILFVSLSLGFYLSVQLGDSYSGFTIAAGFYFILGLVLFLTRMKLVEMPLRDKIIQKILTDIK